MSHVQSNQHVADLQGTQPDFDLKGSRPVVESQDGCPAAWRDSQEVFSCQGRGVDPSEDDVEPAAAAVARRRTVRFLSYET